MSPSANSLWTCRSMRWLSLPFPVDELTNINWGNGYIEATHQTGRWNFISNILYVSVSGISTVNWMLILDIHPNYASILLEKQGQKAFHESLHSFLDKNSVSERAPCPRVYVSLVFPQETTNHDVLAPYISISWLLESTFLWRRPQKAIGNLFLTFLYICFKLLF